MSRHRSRSGGHVGFSTIDVTPLVDLTFLLLIVFMITAPVLENAMDITPPSLSADKIDDTPHRVINLNVRGEILLGEQPMTPDSLVAELATLHATQPKLVYYIRADESRPYKEVMAIMRMVRTAGITNVSLLTIPEED